MTHMIYF